jgi:hypothetical protein
MDTVTTEIAISPLRQRMTHNMMMRAVWGRIRFIVICRPIHHNER